MIDTSQTLRNCSSKMKTKITTLLAMILLVATGISRAVASENNNGPLAVAVDAVIARPACFAATIVGSAIFVITLPVAATSKSIKQTADALVVAPAKATFSRPLGDLDALSPNSMYDDDKQAND